MSGEIGYRKQAETALRRSAQRLEGLHTIDRAILAAQSSLELTQQALVQMRRLLPYQQAFVLVLNSIEQKAEIIASTGEAPGSGAHQILALETLGVEGEELLASSCTSDATVGRQPCPQELANFVPEPTGNCVRLPLEVENTLMGELVLFLSPGAPFIRESEAIAQEVAAQLAVALHQQHLAKPVEPTELITAIVSMLNSKN